MAERLPSNSRGGRQGDVAASPLDAPRIARGRRLADRYRLERRLGHGGMAAVWLASDERLERPVAIKVLSDTLAGDDDYLVRFRREATVAASLQHPNLVGVYDFASQPRPYLVMEYVPGGDLGARPNGESVPEPGRLARELLAALRHIHGAGVLHRDIKPQNVLIDADGGARLTDFGIAQPRDATSLTRTGQVIGTERYIAPEVMAGEPASERSDLYSLGVVLADVLDDGNGEPVRDLTDRLRDADPDRRPISAAAALAALERRPTVGEPTQPYAVEPTGPAAPGPNGSATTEALPGAASRRPFEPSASGRSRTSRRGAIGALVAIVLAAIAVVVIALGTGGDSGSRAPRGAGEGAGKVTGGGGGERSAEQPSEPAASGGGAAAAGSAAAGDGGGAATASDSFSAEPASDGASLNDQGFALVQDGRYDEAIPVLERAVDALRGSGDQTTYNYALYNLATAYLSAGRPEDAIPLLEERMQFDDGQLDTVQATLDEARAAAGQASTSDESASDGSSDEGSSGGAPALDEKPGKGPKPGKDPK